MNSSNEPHQFREAVARYEPAPKFSLKVKIAIAVVALCIITGLILLILNDVGVFSSNEGVNNTISPIYPGTPY